MDKLISTPKSKLFWITLVIFFMLSALIYVGDRTGASFSSNRGFPHNDDDEDSTRFESVNLLERAVYIERQERLQRECSNYRRRQHALQLNNSHFTSESIWHNKELLEHIIVDEKHHLLYCYVPKVACTNWKRTLLFLSGQSNSTRSLDIPADLVHRNGVFPKLANFTSEVAAEMLRTYTTFILVRHPLERLLSAFRNKLEQHYSSSKYFQSRFGRYIVKTFRQNPSNHSLEYGDDVTFAEFVTFVTSEVAQGKDLNEHWKPIHQLCAPCAVKYDVIGKYETLYEDADYLLRQLGEPLSAFPRFAHPSSTNATSEKYFGSLTVNLLKKLYSMYEIDFHLFGYNVQELLGFEVD